MKTADHVLELLFDRGEKFYLADDLAREGGLTARRLNAALELLRQRGHELEFSPAHGLRLRRPVNLDAHLIERGLCTRRVGKHVICFDEVGSTNDVAFDCARQKDADGLVVLAQSQRLGRGRHGKRWQSPRGANVLASVLLCTTNGTNGDTNNTNKKNAKERTYELLTVAAGLAVAQGVEDAAGLNCRLKWPNDVLVDGAKLAGVLVEVKAVSGRKWIVIGVGINVNAHPPAGQVDLPATSVAEHVGHAADRLEIVRRVLRRLDRWVADLPDAMENLRQCWLERCDMINQRITVSSAGRRHVGRVLDVSPLEGLTLICDDGRRVRLPASGSTIIY